ncbi:DUF2490 domain-containing protein [Sandaracinus amylolyticus]|uniref:DUF2490 domain-containing protein n=1 Tax=Sandaracinus amylolyticus TaxID=927083 RepID=A0A0F6SEK0_9BACT|nr:DUF2490 domain-containing protein [Sandaracinus amylolyticus]AKF05329.1 hypothetical protein DB32_002478 [Sandaracinus amylolyticus]
MTRWIVALAIVLSTCSVLAPSRVHAQAYDDSYQTWLSVAVQGNVTPDWTLYIDLNWRFWDDFGPYQQLYRPAVAYRVAPGMHVWLGYGWTPSWSRDEVLTDEHRIWEQWTWDLQGLEGGLKIFFRSRLEQRFRPEISSDVGIRFRQFARVLVPFARDFPVHLSLWDEVFIGLNDAGLSAGGLWQRLGFDQNRLFVGVGWNVVPGQLRLEAGYMNHWIVRPTQDEVHHVAMLNGFVTIQ